ncbi:MAG TPA: hypothetical protein VKV24_13360, partial [Casimicrobiaceae bacterium]|nr:hypothetical protein [Casimicrobiaceae bacterium]
MKRLFGISIVALFTITPVDAYEQATHAVITRAAFSASDLGAGSLDSLSPLQRSLGLDVVSPLGDGVTYFEFIGNISGISPYQRTAQPYEKKILKDLETDPQTSAPMVWLMYGAIREDDNPNETPRTPQDVEAGIRRPLHHFFDPFLNRPLTAAGLSEVDNDVRKSVDWGLGLKNSFGDPNAQETPRRNHFTVFDAREAMFRALTLMSSSTGSYVSIAEGVDAAKREKWRQAYWATTFRALGDVLHLNQDMAQPQHTRNEPHSGSLCPGSRVCLTGHTSVYEKYINARALRKGAFDSFSPFNQPLTIPLLNLPLDGYPIPAFSSYPNYWSTAPGSQVVQGKGLADYSNRGFFSAAKNFASPKSEYSSPSSNPLDYAVEPTLLTKWDGTPLLDSLPAYIYFGKVHDSLQGSDAIHVPLTTLGYWDQFIKKASGSTSYSLNRVNYDAMANLLIPRAVAYSAGLINFFFRGQIEISPPKEGVFAVADHSINGGFKKLRANIKNISPLFFDAQGTLQVQNMQGGTFFAVVRYHKDKKYTDSLDTVVGVAPCADYTSVIDTAHLEASTVCRDGVEEIVVSKPLNAISLDAGSDATVDFDFSDSPIPFGMTDVVLQVVYRGSLGSETDAVAVGTLDVSEPTYFTYLNASDYIHIGGHVYQRPAIESDSELLAAVRPQYCADYQQVPPKIRPGCLEEFDLDLTFSFQDLAKPIAEARQVPVRKLVRFVYLGLADETSGGRLKKKMQRITVQAHRHGGGDKALLYQQTNCLPTDPLNISPRRSQMTVLSPTEYIYTVDRLKSVRGV